jgi:glycosyltransferase involved in cell wall biosynthesis
MKIIFSCGSYSWGGLEMQTIKLARAFRLAGHEVVLLVPKDSTLLKKALKEDLTIKAIDWKGIKTISNIFLVKKIIRAFKADIVHTQLSHDLLLLSPAISKKSKTALLMTRRMSSGISKKDLFHAYLYSKIDLMLCISAFIKDNVIKTVPIHPDKVKVHYNGLNLDKFNPNQHEKSASRAIYKISNDSFVIGFLGRFTPMKGHRELFEAGSILLKKYPNLNLLFVIAGGDSFGEEKYGNEARALGKRMLGERVIYTGNTDDTPQILSTMDILAFPSHEESFGNVLCEAAAMKIPVVASENGGVPDIVVNGETGILVKAKDSIALANGIATYIDNPEMAKMHAANARDYVINKFSEDKQITELESIYSELILMKNKS